MENFTHSATANVRPYVGMPIHACAAASVDSSALIVRERRAAVVDWAGMGLATVAGDVKRGLGDFQTTTPGTRAWRPPS